MGKGYVELPSYVIAFVGDMMKKLRLYGMVDCTPAQPDEVNRLVLTIPFNNTKYEYCYDGIQLIAKTMKKRGIWCHMVKYERVGKDDNMSFNYVFELRKLKDK